MSQARQAAAELDALVARLRGISDELLSARQTQLSPQIAVRLRQLEDRARLHAERETVRNKLLPARRRYLALRAKARRRHHEEAR